MNVEILQDHIKAFTREVVDSEVVKKLAAVNGQAIGNVRLLHHERTICSVSVAP